MNEADLIRALHELYLAFASEDEPHVRDWWERQADDAAERGMTSADLRRRALARARTVLSESARG